jgi:GAF domain-containing protein
VISTKDLVGKFKGILEELLAKTKASRTTLRLDVPERGFHTNGVVAEALAPGVKSIAGETSLQQRKSMTASLLEKTRTMLVQNDCENADTPPPKELMQIYGTKAQMVAPVVRGGDMVGWVSVHYNVSTREWSKQDMAALEAAVAATHKQMDTM